MAINGIQIKGRMYGSDKFTPLLFFDRNIGNTENNRKITKPILWATVLGRNGAGKSTISTALWRLTQHQTEQSVQLSETDELQAELVPGNSIGIDHIYVFNDDFIRTKLKFDSDKIGAVLMLKEQEDIKQNLQTAEDEKIHLLQTIAELQYDIGCSDEKPEISKSGKSATDTERLCTQLKEAERKLTTVFKRKEGWAETIRLIRNHRHNEAVSIDKIDTLYKIYNNQLLDDDTAAEERIKFKKRLNEFLRFQNETNTGIKDVQAPSKGLLINLLTSISRALDTHPESAHDGANSLVDLLQSASPIFDLAMIKDYLSQQPAPTRCDKCLQIINPDWRDTVLKAIDEINASSEIHDLLSSLSKSREAVLKYKQEVNCTDIPSELLEPSDAQRFQDCKENLLDDLTGIENDIEKKINSPYAVISPASLSSAQGNNKPRILSHLDEFVNSINRINKSIKMRSEQLTEERSQLINDVTILECSRNKSPYEAYDSLRNKRDKKATELEKTKKELETKQDEIITLNNQLGQFNIAMDKINESLRLVFLSPNRLQLEASAENDDTYAISVRGKRVPLHNLSTGEKNAIAIAYYFSMPYENKVEHPLFNESMLFVLDDPITSLDRSNEIGIFSLIEKEFTSLKKALYQGSESHPTLQIMVMTHNYQVFYAMQHVGQSVFPRDKTTALVLSNCAIQKVNNNKPAYTYRTLVEHVYNFAKRDENNNHEYDNRDYTIANELRRALEEYSWFNFGVGGTGLRKQPLVRSKLDELVKENRLSKESEDLILSVLYSIWANSGSHREENANSDVQDLDLLDYNDTNEVRKIAKLILILLDEIHFTGLPGLMWGSRITAGDNHYNECKSNIEKWKSDFSFDKD